MDNATPVHSTADAPRTQTEKTLMEIWSAVLGAEDIGIHDDFFSLGGDSLAAMRCINRVTAEFGVELPLDLLLLESAPVAKVAFEVDKARLAGSDTLRAEDA